MTCHVRLHSAAACGEPQRGQHDESAGTTRPAGATDGSLGGGANSSQWIMGTPLGISATHTRPTANNCRTAWHRCPAGGRQAGRGCRLTPLLMEILPTSERLPARRHPRLWHVSTRTVAQRACVSTNADIECRPKKVAQDVSPGEWAALDFGLPVRAAAPPRGCAQGDVLRCKRALREDSS